MNHEHHGSGQAPSGQERAEGGGSARTKIVFAILLAIAAFFLLTEHRAHLFGFLPYLLVLACPLLHMFHHGGHGRHAHGHADEPQPREPQQPRRKES